MRLNRIVVTGMGALTPIGNTVSEYWDNLIKGVSGAGLITYFDTSKHKTKFACELKGFHPEKFMDKKEVRKKDPFVHYAMAASQEAVQDSNADFSKLNTDRIGVIWGAGIGGLKAFHEEIIDFVKGNEVPKISPFFIPKLIIDIAPGCISMKYGLRGPNFATVSACASSNNALIDAYHLLRLGKADMFITGGSEAIINKVGIGGFNALHALSTRNDSPETASRPFDLDRDGFVTGEGAGALILEELEHAKKRGAKIYAEMVGCGMTADAYHITAPHPEGLGAKNVMKFALEDAQMTVDDIDYINVHGTSTPLGDLAEIKAIIGLFGESAYKLNISSTKSMTGHLLGAAGAIEAIASILAITHGEIPPTINHFNDDPKIDPKLNLTFNKSQKRVVKATLSNTFGFGGHNTSVIFKKFQE